MKNIRVFLSENFQFLEVKFSIYLNRRVFIILNFVVCRIVNINDTQLSYSVPYTIFEQRRPRSACASAQSDQFFCCHDHFGHWALKVLSQNRKVRSQPVAMRRLFWTLVVRI